MIHKIPYIYYRFFFIYQISLAVFRTYLQHSWLNPRILCFRVNQISYFINLFCIYSLWIFSCIIDKWVLCGFRALCFLFLFLLRFRALCLLNISCVTNILVDKKIIIISLWIAGDRDLSFRLFNLWISNPKVYLMRRDLINMRCSKKCHNFATKPILVLYDPLLLNILYQEKRKLNINRMTDGSILRKYTSLHLFGRNFKEI